MKESKLPLTEELDFHYLLSLLPPLYAVPEFAWLPELFSIIGHERLIKLCRYAGGETIQIPTLEQLEQSISALQWFYDVNIVHKKDPSEVPQSVCELYNKIVGVYRAGASEELH